ncbi:disulfide bond formation protein B [Pararhizobium haloflavum]|uniref:disulfide bond formation protein B n=1 Tax=Pararhizobium haloflavum TaxID=2037914 RepID=UPI001FE119B6|nr:disulfide bond formation protein B [Pararhizobium haloflavum]
MTFSLRNPVFLASLLLFGMMVTVGGALAFEHIGGFIPCALCLQQRTPYYIGIPIAALALASLLGRAPFLVTRLLFLAAFALMAYGAGLGAYHSGVEWGWWEGPVSCGGGGFTSDAGSLLSQLDATRPPSCNDAAGRFLGLSFAGWNVIASLGLAAIALRGLLLRRA